MNRYIGLLATAQSNGNAHTNTTTSASLLPTAAKPIIPGGFFSYIGQEIIVEASGRMSYVGAGGGAIQFILRRGPTPSTDDIALSGNLSLNTTFGQLTDITWKMIWSLTLRAVGSAAVFMHTGFFASGCVVGSAAGGEGKLLIPGSVPAIGLTFNSAIDNIIDLVTDWTVASAGNSIQLHQYKLISVN